MSERILNNDLNNIQFNNQFSHPTSFPTEIKYIGEMKKLILLLLFIPLVFSCSEKSLEGDNSKKFREIYNETFWNGSNFRVSFETGKLILINDIPGLNMECGYLLEGTYDSDWDGCTYNPVTTVVITENSNSFIYREKIGDGKCNTPGCSYQCGASGEVEYTFQVLTENTIEFNMKVLNSDESYKSTLIKTDNSF